MAIYHKRDVRRTQAVAPRKSARAPRSKPSSRANKGGGVQFRVVLRFLKDYASFLLFAAAVASLVILYNVFTASEVFKVKGVEVIASTPTLRAEVEQAVRRGIGTAQLMDVDLEGIRQKVESLTRVREAGVARVLPDKIVVEVSERQPAVLVRRRNGALAWLDADAVEIGEFALHAGTTQKVPPPAIGFAEGALTPGMVIENHERLTLYRQIEQEFAAGDSLWNKVDEIDLSSTKYVNVRLANSTINVALGSENFRQRFETAIDVLKAVEEYDVERLGRYNVRDVEQVLANADRISYIYPAKNNGIVLNFSAPRSERSSGAGTQPRTGATAAASPKAEAKRTLPVKTVVKKDPQKADRKDDRERTVRSAPGRRPAGKKTGPGKTR